MNGRDIFKVAGGPHILLAIGDVHLISFLLTCYCFCLRCWTASGHKCQSAVNVPEIFIIMPPLLLFWKGNMKSFYDKKWWGWWLLQASVRLMPSTMLYSGRSADQIHLIVRIKAVIIEVNCYCCCFVVVTVMDDCSSFLLLVRVLLWLLTVYWLYTVWWVTQLHKCVICWV